MKVLSLFDGIACGYEALSRAGIPIDAYYASEIDKYAIKVAMKNHPDIIQVGDVCKLTYHDGMLFMGPGEDEFGPYDSAGVDGPIDLIIGGSPCQNLSAAGNGKGLEGEKSSLFYEFVRLVKEIKPRYFLLENVKMKKEWMEKMSEELWDIKPTLIDSALVSAQRRKRLYWVGKLLPNGEYCRIEIPQPEDKGILLKDILQDDVDEKYYLSEKQINMIANWGGYEKPLERIKTGEDKMDTLTTHCGKMSNGIKLVSVPCATQIGNSKNFGNSYGNDKAYTLRACNPNGVIESVNPTRIRKLTPEECEMLQNLNPGYTEGISDTQRYKALGNGWTVNVLAHIFTFLKE